MLTQVYTYHLTHHGYVSSPDYAHAELAPIRTSSRGLQNLTQYVNELEGLFSEFTSRFPSPLHPSVYSYTLRDLMKIPKVDDQGQPLTEAERSALFTRTLFHPSQQRPDGSWFASWGLSPNDVHPLTQQHMLLFIQSGLYGERLGDNEGSVTLIPHGESIMHGHNVTTWHRFTPYTAALNPLIGGLPAEPFDVYRNDQLRHMPLLQNDWMLQLNPNAINNQDINLATLRDLSLHFHVNHQLTF